MRSLAVAAATALLFALAPSGAALGAATLVTPVLPGDAAIGAPLVSLGSKVAFFDADSDNRIDNANPDETVYLDIGGDGRASYGDLRLTRFGDYAAGTLVAVDNRDLGLPLATPSGWFALRGADLASFDSDFSTTLSVGDVRLDGTKVAAGDSDIGAATPIAQGSSTPQARVGFVDQDGNGMHDASEPVYLDMDPQSTGGARKVSEGDVRFVLGSFGVDDTVPRAEFEALRDTPAGEPGGVEAAPRGVTSFDWLLVALAVLNLIGLAYVTREVNRQRPRNPFK